MAWMREGLRLSPGLQSETQGAPTCNAEEDSPAKETGKEWARNWGRKFGVREAMWRKHLRREWSACVQCR